MHHVAQKSNVYELIMKLRTNEEKCLWHAKNNCSTSKREVAELTTELKDILGITTERKSIVTEVLAEMQNDFRYNPGKVGLSTLGSDVLTKPLEILPKLQPYPQFLNGRLLANLQAREILKNPALIKFDIAAYYRDHGTVAVIYKEPKTKLEAQVSPLSHF